MRRFAFDAVDPEDGPALFPDATVSWLSRSASSRDAVWMSSSTSGHCFPFHAAPPRVSPSKKRYPTLVATACWTLHPSTLHTNPRTNALSRACQEEQWFQSHTRANTARQWHTPFGGPVGRIGKLRTDPPAGREELSSYPFAALCSLRRSKCLLLSLTKRNNCQQ